MAETESGPQPGELRLAMLGMIEGNGHPYSWSAIINGYDPAEMARCPYPVIPVYLGKQPLESVRIPGARVTHIWTDDPADAPGVAAASKIEHVVKRPEEVIGHVDAVVIATDDGDGHVARTRPFVEAGLPVFVDKPLATNLADLNQFVRWHADGRAILSTSGLRYAPEMHAVAQQRDMLGELRWVTSLTCKTWERYGIHALEAVYPLVGPGFTHVRTHPMPGSDVVHLSHSSGAQLTIAAIHDAAGSFGTVHVYGTKGQLPLRLTDTYTAFREQLLAFIEFVRTGRRPFPFEQTVELMAILIAGIRSGEQSGRAVALDEVFSELRAADDPAVDRDGASATFACRKPWRKSEQRPGPRLLSAAGPAIIEGNTQGRITMPIRSELPTQNDLEKLPLGAIVAYAVRCARRVQPLYGRAAGIAELAKHEAAVGWAISLAEDFCLSHVVNAAAYDAAYVARTSVEAVDARDAARAAAAAARAAAYAFDVPRSAVYDRAVYASRVAAEAVDGAKAAARAADHASDGARVVEAAARADFDRLLELNQGTYPKLGQPIDPTENGPLGPLWPAEAPTWWQKWTASSRSQ